MLHITDYLKWRGDLSFNERPFTNIDNLIFCQLGYLDLKCIWSEDITEMTFREAVEKLDGKFDYKLAVSSADDDLFTRSCAESERFGTLRITDYVDIVSPADDKQFAAITFHLPDGEKVVVFRGTDDTIVGWKEDFMISYTRVPAQEEALKYAERVIEPEDKCIIAGHSKGANLALYAAAFLDEERQSQIEKVYLNDGPGFCPDILPTDKIEIIKDRIVRITPEFCVVGGIFEVEVPENYIVKSSGEQMMQHDLHTWGIEGGELLLAETHDPLSEKVNTIFDKFIEKMDMDNREEFVSRIFDTMSEKGSVTIGDFTHEGVSSFENLLIRVVGWGEFNSNPIKDVGDSLIQDVKHSKKVKPIRENALTRKIIRISVCAVLGFLTAKYPDYFMTTLFSGLLLVVLVFELFKTFKSLKESGWNLKKEKTRVYLSVILLALYILLHVKAGALFILASGAFGINFLFISYQLLILYKNSKGKRASRFRYMLECIMALANGLYILLVPEVADMWYMLSSGLLLMFDAFVETIILIKMVFRDLKKNEDVK